MKLNEAKIFEQQETPGRVATYDKNKQLRAQEIPEEYQDQYANPVIFTAAVESWVKIKEIRDAHEIRIDRSGSSGLDWAYENTPKKVGKMFQAHGVAKDSPIEAMDNILKKWH